MLFAPAETTHITFNRIPVDSGKQFQVMLPIEVGPVMIKGSLPHAMPCFPGKREKPAHTCSQPENIPGINQVACLSLNDEISRSRSPGGDNRGRACVSLQHGSPEGLVAFRWQQKELRFRHGPTGLLQGKLPKK